MDSNPRDAAAKSTAFDNSNVDQYVYLQNIIASCTTFRIRSGPGRPCGFTLSPGANL
jgi:hypothetical protein